MKKAIIKVLTLTLLICGLAGCNNEGKTSNDNNKGEKNNYKKEIELVEIFCKTLVDGFTSVNTDMVSKDIIEDVWLIKEFDTYLGTNILIENMVIDNIGSLMYKIDKKKIEEKDGKVIISVSFDYNNLCKEYYNHDYNEFKKIKKGDFDNIMGDGMYEKASKMMEDLKKKGNKKQKLNEKVLITVENIEGKPLITNISSSLKEVMSGGIYGVMKENTEYINKVYGKELFYE